MYELVKRILDKSKDEKVSIDVAYNKCAREDGIGYTDDLKEAYEIIETHYDTITKLRREKDEESIKKLCDLVAAGDKFAIRAFKEEIEER